MMPYIMGQTSERGDKKLDVGRLISLSVFSFLLALNVSAVYGDAIVLAPFSTIKIATLIHRVFLVIFYVFVVFFYLERSAAKSTTRSLIARTIAIIASFLPFAIPFLSSPSVNPGIMLTANLITIVGMIISVYSLSALGKSISIIPQARTLVQTGPYKHIRHPLYLGELISLAGIVLARFSMSALTIYCLIMAMQIYRASQEERLLAGMFPEYEPYCLKSARFIPGIF